MSIISKHIPSAWTIAEERTDPRTPPVQRAGDEPAGPDLPGRYRRGLHPGHAERNYDPPRRTGVSYDRIERTNVSRYWMGGNDENKLRTPPPADTRGGQAHHEGPTTGGCHGSEANPGRAGPSSNLRQRAGTSPRDQSSGTHGPNPATGGSPSPPTGHG